MQTLVICFRTTKTNNSKKATSQIPNNTIWKSTWPEKQYKVNGPVWILVITDYRTDSPVMTLTCFRLLLYTHSILVEFLCDSTACFISWPSLYLWGLFETVRFWETGEQKLHCMPMLLWADTKSKNIMLSKMILKLIFLLAVKWY